MLFPDDRENPVNLHKLEETRRVGVKLIDDAARIISND